MFAAGSAGGDDPEQPLEILAYELVPDKAGAGKYRGGIPYCREYRLLENEAVLQVRSDRRDFRPYGLYGGEPGKPSSNVLNPDDENRPLTAKLTMTMKKGDVLRHELAGPGGWGDPLERDPSAVLLDLRNEVISADTASDVYGVIIDTSSWSVDQAATEARRDAIRSLRRWSDAPFVQWIEPDRSDGKASAGPST